jgi:hypothetical protein
MGRFIYQAYAMAIGGPIRRPIDQQVQTPAMCVLPSTGGTVVSTSGPYRLTDPASGEFLLCFDSAETSAEGKQSATQGVYTTLVSSIVRNLNVGNVLRADEVTLKLSLAYDTSNDQVTIDTNGSRFVNLIVAGQGFDVSLDHALGREAADYQTFRQNHPQYPEIRGAIRYSLGRHPLLHFDPYEYGYYDQQNFGRIYFAEWTAAPYKQELTMLRLRLGSPQEGDPEIGGGGGNGTPFP